MVDLRVLGQVNSRDEDAKEVLHKRLRGRCIVLWVYTASEARDDEIDHYVRGGSAQFPRYTREKFPELVGTVESNRKKLKRVRMTPTKDDLPTNPFQYLSFPGNKKVEVLTF
ncbi:hypothetical protein R1flu_018943 [Riccia fluitans]|uniref:Uncharacterized protein n=1 Tax=Riccia fluitans TaxID=41844 RepID=A0ABD1ZHL3_9MARC